LSTASRADRVVMLENGRIVEDGSHSVLLGARGKYAALYEAWLNSTSGSTNA
jgi:ABC-type multidrug transport system fused ATPase/permease subunit